MKVIRSMLLSLVFGLGSVCAVSLVKFMPYSVGRDRIADVLSSPGGLIAAIAYPEGVHTGSGAANWGRVAFLGNLAFYAAAWFFAIWLFGPRARVLGNLNERGPRDRHFG